MSLTNNNILTLINNCFRLPAEISKEYEAVIGKYMWHKEFDAGHRAGVPLAHGDVNRTGSHTLGTSFTARNILMYLSTVEYASMKKIQAHSGANIESTKSCVSNLFTQSKVTREESSNQWGRFFKYSIAKGVII